eukprot:TRINITY_DN12087_c0_g1_i1.p1 TRINITY_DN12087_c0_g1~~TRINITY_DN12087_c0_g1_i1.p1  ORF type:complete len:269 (+),score=53.40 TRINITY_DN12087_c0_g1_i1:96-902(+)
MVSGLRDVPSRIRDFASTGVLCDIIFDVSGHRFPAHAAVFAACSSSFRCLLRASGETFGTQGASSSSTLAEAAEGTHSLPRHFTILPMASSAGAAREIRVAGIDSPRSMGLVLEYVYDVGGGAAWKFRGDSLTTAADVLRLAGALGLPGLQEAVSRWLAEGLTAENAGGRLALCGELHLDALKDKMLKQVSACPGALSIVATSPELGRSPKVLHELLVLATSQNADGSTCARNVRDPVSAALKDSTSSNGGGGARKRLRRSWAAEAGA